MWHAAQTKGEAWDWGGKVSGEGLTESLRKFLKIHTWNHAIWCIVHAKIYLLLLLHSHLLLPVSAQFGPEPSSGLRRSWEWFFISWATPEIRFSSAIRFSPEIRFHIFGVIDNNCNYNIVIFFYSFQFSRQCTVFGLETWVLETLVFVNITGWIHSLLSTAWMVKIWPYLHFRACGGGCAR